MNIVKLPTVTLIVHWLTGPKTVLEDLPLLDASQIEDVYAHKKGVTRIERAV